MSKEFLSELVHYRTYANFLPEEGRRETIDETISRNSAMHIKKFPHLKEEILEAYKEVHAQRAVPSMRSMQFGGDAIHRRNNRMFNCSFVNITSVEDIADLFYMSMSGCGVGYSVKQRHVSQLPCIPEGHTTKRYTIPDSAEGWADSIIALFENPKKEFDYKLIRPSGAKLTSGGTASGPAALIEMHAKVREILHNATGRQLTPFEVHRTCCLIADCVVVGGVRRAALIVLFDYEDKETMFCKAGKWWETYPELARANNSCHIDRNDPEVDTKIREVVQACFDGGQAEPGLSLTNDLDMGFNPCQPAWAKVLTKDGIRQFKDIDVGTQLWSKEGWTTVVKKWSTGVKKVFAYRTTAGVFHGTENHKIVSSGVKIEVGKAETIDSITGPYLTEGVTLNPQDTIDGIVFGDGSVHKASNNLVLLNIGADDHSYMESEIRHLIQDKRDGVGPYAHEVDTTIAAEELPHTYLRQIPDRYFYGDTAKKASFLRGLYTANGSICGQRITLKASSFDVITRAQTMLSSLGIRSYYTTNKPSLVTFSNGEYLCKQSYELNITVDRSKFANLIGFIQPYKQEKLQETLRETGTGTRAAKATYDIRSIDFISEEEVFDITVDNTSHTYWTEGVDVSNCHEISLNSNGVCNLTEVNAGGCKNKEEFLNAVRAATVIGTLQASYTAFEYVSPKWRQVGEEDSLLGVSITGQAEAAPLLTPETLREAAAIAVETNRAWAAKIGIKPAKRITTTKPSGSASSWLGTTAGVHAAHAERYIRRVRMQKTSALGQRLTKFFPNFVVTDPFNQNDIVMQIPIEFKQGVILRDKESAVQCLNRVKELYDNWIIPGHIEGKNTHNISLTINYLEHEKEAITDWMVKNKDSYYGISLIPFSGADYQYAPYICVHKEIFQILQKTFKEMAQHFNFTDIKETEDNTNKRAEAACAGGACAIGD